MSNGESREDKPKKFHVVPGGRTSGPPTIKNAEMIRARGDIFDFVTDIVDNYKGDRDAAINSTKHRIPYETGAILTQILLMRAQPDTYSPELRYALAKTYLQHLAREVGLEKEE